MIAAAFLAFSQRLSVRFESFIGASSKRRQPERVCDVDDGLSPSSNRIGRSVRVRTSQVISAVCRRIDQQYVHGQNGATH